MFKQFSQYQEPNWMVGSVRNFCFVASLTTNLSHLVQKILTLLEKLPKTSVSLESEETTDREGDDLLKASKDEMDFLAVLILKGMGSEWIIFPDPEKTSSPSSSFVFRETASDIFSSSSSFPSSPLTERLFFSSIGSCRMTSHHFSSTGSAWSLPLTSSPVSTASSTSSS
ncbi:hypothetical protein WICPIJ_007863 [Wickerhamomyces pijperi]|uniref:Uncharacterized protein n=1 Tax=Wickerhamomyces pijperi TaxID=599730 RepID=A0A9P8TIU4_WICPI|nr:hypothetical protein WICPIJ_007863 [Wickerhamomyces pijperi]